MIALLSLAFAATDQDEILAYLDTQGVRQPVLTPREGGGYEYVGVQDDITCGGMIALRRPLGQTEPIMVMTECLPQGGALTSTLKEGTSADLVALARKCDAGDWVSCKELGVRQAKGSGTAKDVDGAVVSLGRGCDHHHAPSCTALGIVLRDEKQDSAGAMAAFDGACSGGEAGACADLGLLRVMAKDNAGAAAAFTTGCEGGSQVSCGNLGILTANGKGVPRDEARARELLSGACEAEVGFACKALGEL